jgi:DMSO reductase family type II enzyme chaperone
MSGLSPAARSMAWRRLAEAFRYPVRSSDGAGADYHAAFDPAVSQEAGSLHEAAYASEDRSALLEELLRFYRHFGLARDERAELPDHLEVELEFMHFLCWLEHAASARGEDVAGLRRAQRDFLARHLQRLAAGLAARCAEAPARFAALARMLAEHVEEELGELAGEGS